MKNLKRFYFVAFTALTFMVFALNPADVFAQKKNQEQTLAAFPDNVSGIFKQSCVGCHSDMSRGKAKTFMNLSEWDKLSGKEKFKTARSMRKKVKKGIMPPPMFLEKRPKAALTDAQKEELIAWAKSLKSLKKKK